MSRFFWAAGFGGAIYLTHEMPWGLVEKFPVRFLWNEAAKP
jgi:hypothetical protein